MPYVNQSIRRWIRFFWAAAIFNFVVGAIGMFTSVSSIDTHLVGILVFAFGILYAVLATDPNRYARSLWAGLFGKVGVVALLGSVGLQIDNGGVLASILAVDIFFALGFLLFLLTRDHDDLTSRP